MVVGSFEIKGGNALKVFNDLVIALKAHPEAKIEVNDEEQSYRRN